MSGTLTPPPDDAVAALPPLLAALGALDGLLRTAVMRAISSRGPDAADPFRGLHLGLEDVLHDLARGPGQPSHAIGCDALWVVASLDPRVSAIADAYDLSPFETSCLLLALAPEIDARYERTYGYLQDDVTRKRPTPALALDLFCTDVVDRLHCAPQLAPGANLFRHHLLDTRPAGGTPHLSSALCVDPQCLRYLLGAPGIDPSLASWSVLIPPASVSMPAWLSPSDVTSLKRVAEDAAASGAPLVMHFHGAAGTGKLQAARALGGHIGKPLLIGDLRGAVRAAEGFDGSVRRLVRESVLQRAVLFLRGYDTLVEGREWQALRALSDALTRCPGIAIVAGERAWRDGGASALAAMPVAFDRDEAEARTAAWRSALDDCGLPLDDDAVGVLAERFRLRPAQIASCVAAACARHRWGTAAALEGAPHQPGLAELALAARAESGQALAALARRVVPKRRWSDLVLPPETLAVLREIGDRVVHRHRVLTDWGFDRQLSLGKGVTALLAGPSGTGKTLAAEVLAAELGLDLFRIDLSRVVSKYIGETEQNLDRVFDAARDANAVLLFDEAEALFGKRTEVRDAHDRYANLEISYFLQKMEEFDGLAILSTNLRQNIDEAFTRRIAFTVHFPFPDEENRRRIWEIIWPDRTPRAGDVDAAALGRELMLSGGNIKNAALAAAFYAAADGGVVTRTHVLLAARREFQKMGRVPSPAEALA